MKNYEEICEALLAGETLIKVDMTVRKLLNGELVDVDNKTVLDEGFNFPDIWQIHKEPKWYENIPDGGVLCRVGTHLEGERVRLLTKFDGEFPTTSNGIAWGESEPLTKQEIQVFMNNAPDSEPVKTGCNHDLVECVLDGSLMYYKCTKCNHVQGYK